MIVFVVFALVSGSSLLRIISVWTSVVEGLLAPLALASVNTVLGVSMHWFCNPWMLIPLYAVVCNQLNESCISRLCQASLIPYLMTYQSPFSRRSRVQFSPCAGSSRQRCGLTSPIYLVPLFSFGRAWPWPAISLKFVQVGFRLMWNILLVAMIFRLNRVLWCRLDLLCCRCQDYLPIPPIAYDKIFAIFVNFYRASFWNVPRRWTERNIRPCVCCCICRADSAVLGGIFSLFSFYSCDRSNWYIGLVFRNRLAWNEQA